jgi:hypothetical protein
MPNPDLDLRKAEISRREYGGVKTRLGHNYQN